MPPPAAIAPDGIGPLVQPGESSYDDFARYGFRVPSVVVSPYAKPGYTSHVLYDLTGFLDLSVLAAKQPTFPRLPALAAPGDTAAALACSTTGPGAIPPPGSISG